MNKIGDNQCKDILDSFAWDSTGYDESPGIRARERKDSHVFYFRDWFNIVSDRGLREGRCFKIYENSVRRNLFVEYGNVSLCAKSWDKAIAGRIARCEYGDRMRKEWEEKRLIAKQIKKQTYLGEEHARESLYDTIEECLANGEELVIAEGKSKEAQAVIDYLRYLELERQIINLQQQGVDLSNEEKSVNAEIISLQDKITGLRTQQTTLQEKQKGLQEQQKELQESQDKLLM